MLTASFPVEENIDKAPVLALKKDSKIIDEGENDVR